MIQNKVLINDEWVPMVEPESGSMGNLIGREEEMKCIHASFLSTENIPPNNPLLIGKSGVGKTKTIWEFAKICGQELHCQQGHEDLTAFDLIYTISTKLEKGLSKLSTAMVRGGIYYLDSIGKMRKKALACLESVLDHRRYLDASTEFGTNIKAHPGFRFIAATNPEDLEGDQFEDWLKNRLKPKIEFGYPNRQELDRILEAHHLVPLKNSKRLINCFWKYWIDRNKDKPVSVRTYLDVFGYAQKQATIEKMEQHSNPFVLTYHGNPAVIEEKHIEQAVDVNS